MANEWSAQILINIISIGRPVLVPCERLCVSRTSDGLTNNGHDVLIVKKKNNGRFVLNENAVCGIQNFENMLKTSMIYLLARDIKQFDGTISTAPP